MRACPFSALEIKGNHKEAESVFSIVEQDMDFYEASGGGLTVSGGEPLSQFDFTYKLLSMAKHKGIHTCVETCGFVPTERIIKASEVTDIFLYDFKESNAEKHKEFTGADNALILKNLFELDNIGSKIILRCPIIPGLNDRQDHLSKIAHIAERLKNILEVNIMPYHPMGSSKSKRIGRQYPLEGLGFSEKADVQSWINGIQQNTRVPVKKG
jgi:pyruvate formate lyase activating enzyme